MKDWENRGMGGEGMGGGPEVEVLKGLKAG